MESIDVIRVNPLVSIITVVFNGADTIKQTIESVINQTYNNIEYIIIDGNSTDGTQEIVEMYKDNVACFVSEEDEGIYDAKDKDSLANRRVYYWLNLIRTISH